MLPMLQVRHYNSPKENISFSKNSFCGQIHLLWWTNYCYVGLCDTRWHFALAHNKKKRGLMPHGALVSHLHPCYHRTGSWIKAKALSNTTKSSTLQVDLATWTSEMSSVFSSMGKYDAVIKNKTLRSPRLDEATSPRALEGCCLPALQ